MIYTLDTNILVYAADMSFPLHGTARAVRDHAVAEHHKVRRCYSVLVKFFAVVTDSRRVGNPLPPAEAWREVDAYVNTFEVLYADEGTFAQLRELAKQYQTTQQTIFDVLIVAMMIQHEVNGIYTDDRKDFATFDEIEVLPWPSADV